MAQKRIYVGTKSGRCFAEDAGALAWIYFLEDGKEYFVRKNGQIGDMTAKFVERYFKNGDWSELTAEQLAAFRPELVEEANSKYFGLVVNSRAQPYNDVYKGPYVMFAEDGKLYALHLNTGKAEHLKHWKAGEWDAPLHSDTWRYFTNCQMEKLMSEHRSVPAPAPVPVKTEQKVKYFGLGNPPQAFARDIFKYVLKVEGEKVFCYYLSDGELEHVFSTSSEFWKNNYQTTWSEFTPDAFEALFKTNEVKRSPDKFYNNGDVKTLPNPPKPMSQIAKPVAAKIPPLNPKKGSLYFNTTTKQVERVITVQDLSLIWSSKHKQEVKAYPRSAFRLATKDEVEAYLSAV